MLAPGDMLVLNREHEPIFDRPYLFLPKESAAMRQAGVSVIDRLGNVRKAQPGELLLVVSTGVAVLGLGDSDDYAMVLASDTYACIRTRYFRKVT